VTRVSLNSTRKKSDGRKQGRRRDGQVVNQPVRRSQNLRGQEPFGSGDGAKNHETEDGNNGSYHVAHKTESFPMAEMKQENCDHR